MSARSLPPLSSYASAAVATVIGFGGTVALVVQAGQTLGANPAQIVSMVTVLCLGISLSSSLLSWRIKMPVVLAWSTPGAALLAASSLGLSWPSAVGAFIVASILMILTGIIPAMGRLAGRIPHSLASAMLAGILLPFSMALFSTMTTDLALALGLLTIFVLIRRVAPRWTLPIVLLAAFAALALRGQLGLPPNTSLFGSLSFTRPEFSWQAAISLGIPLYLVNLASQNLPGFVVLRSEGYDPPVNRLTFWSGFTSLVTSPFGSHGVNLAAVIAALCTGPDAHPDARKRWVVGLFYGGFYLGVALFAAPLAGLFIAMPPESLAMITGLALIAPLTGALISGLSVPAHREPAILTLCATASGLTLFGVGSAFWGLVVGCLALMVLSWRKKAALK